ncbi:MAG: nucleotide exchange factor GrpE [Acidimicrobiia bacterium]|nr:nucleotide exchange factor GrpE [Acidimicrobiia bacterium]
MTEQNQGGDEQVAIVEALKTPNPHDLGIELPEDRDEAVDFLLRALEASQQESTSYLDDLKRVAADFDNYRKRTLREQRTILDRAAERVIQKLLPALDSLDAAVNTKVESEAGQQLLSGMLGTREQLLAALGEEGLRVIPTVGEKFDPEVHEPVGAPSGEGQLVVSQELRRGYLLNDRLIRAALVTLELKET